MTGNPPLIEQFAILLRPAIVKGAHVKLMFASKSIQVISHQVITGEQGKKYCKTLPAPFERHDSEFSGDVSNNDSLNLPCMSQSLHIMKA